VGDTFTGTGVVIGSRGEILTNSHVVAGCESIVVRPPSEGPETATLIARDEHNDLAVIRTHKPLKAVATFREGTAIRAGDAVVVLGYPLSGLLAATANLTVGNVSALAGLGNDSRYLQISAPVQPGNSGGPLLDASGHLIGIVTSKLNAVVKGSRIQLDRLGPNVVRGEIAIDGVECAGDHFAPRQLHPTVIEPHIERSPLRKNRQ
jgi:S1-C subfamily serine protease